MKGYVVQRFAASLGSLALLSIIIFVLLRALPGGTAEAVLGENASQAAVEQLNSEYGFDKPLWQQYVDWVADVVRLDFGQSLYRGREAVTSVIAGAIWPSVELAIATIIVALVIAIPVGTISAVKRNTVWDFLPRSVTIILLAIPEFWIGSMILIVAAREFEWSPPLTYAELWEDPASNISHMFLPALILGGIYSAMLARLVRSSMLDVLTSDYVRTARAKGLRESTVILRHCLKQSLLPVVTFLGIQLGRLLGGVVIVEVLFAIPGIGQRLLLAINQRDFPVVQGLVLAMGFAFVMVNLMVDISYGLLDPRVRGRS